MNRQYWSYVLLSAALLGCAHAADTNNADFTPLKNGFGYVARVHGVVDRSLTMGLWYRDATGKTVRVWPHLQMVWGANIQITNNVAVLVGGIASIESDGKERLCDRLIAFEAPSGPPVEITDQIYRQYCAKTGVAFGDIVTNTFHALAITNDSLQIVFTIREAGHKDFSSAYWRGATNTISWHDIESIIQDVKKNGKSKKEKWSGVEYWKWEP